MAGPILAASAIVNVVGLILGRQASQKQSKLQRQQADNAAAQAAAQAEYDKQEAQRVKDEEVAADIAAAEEKKRQDKARADATEKEAAERLAEEERIRKREQEMERQRFEAEKSAAWRDYNLEVARLTKEAEVAATQAEEEIDASRLRTQQAQADISKNEELVAAAQTAGFAARGIAPGSRSAMAVMKRSADQALEEKMKLQENFDLFANTRRNEALRVKESGELAASQLSERIKIAEGKGRLELQQMRERGEIAAGAGEFSLKQFQQSNTRELEFASKFLDMDIEAARRKGERADRAIAAIEENEQYVATGYTLQNEASQYSAKYNTLGMVTGIAGQGLDLYTSLSDQGFFTTTKSPFFTNISSNWGNSAAAQNSSSFSLPKNNFSFIE